MNTSQNKDLWISQIQWVLQILTASDCNLLQSPIMALMCVQDYKYIVLMTNKGIRSIGEWKGSAEVLEKMY